MAKAAQREMAKKMLDRKSDLKKSNRALSMLSRINRTIVRAESSDGLYKEVCTIAVDCGLFDFAWIGLVAPKTGKLRPLARTGGVDDVLPQLAEPGGLADTARRTGEIAIYNNLAALPVTMHCEQLAHLGLQAMATLPLCEGGEVAAVFSLYTSQRDCFDQTVVSLLTEVADDISFSLDHQLNEQRRLAAEAKLHYMASYNTQTGMPNRALLEERLPQLAARAAQRGASLALLDIRLKRLERIAQLLGHTGMDEVIRTIALRLEGCRGTNGLLAQLSYEEFVLVAELMHGSDIDAFALQVRRTIEQPVNVNGKEMFLRAALGGVMYQSHEHDLGYLLRRARAAAERSETEGEFRLYSPDLDRDLELYVEMEAELHRALERDEFLLYYQPQLNLKSGEVVGVEALLRWQQPQHGLVPPAQFIPLLEECGLMPRVGTWVLRTACAQASEWERQGLPAIRMAVNLSAQQFRLADLVETVKAALDDAGLAPEYLELELTESLILENAEQTIHTMHELKKLGVSLSLDDFGTGYSSLSYLRRYPVDRVKIDQSFIGEMMEYKGSAALVRSILAMTHNLGLRTIAEGVETPAQLGYLRQQVCQEMQGYLFSKPLLSTDVVQLLREGRRLDPGDPLSEAASTLLVLDDEPNVLQALRRAFRREGWRLLTATSACDALHVLASHNVGVVVSDLRMPGLSGADFLRRAREMYPDTVRILLTGYPDVSTVVDAVNRGDLYKVLSKPIDDELLREHIRDAFRRYETIVETRRLHARIQEAERLIALCGERNVAS